MSTNILGKTVKSNRLRRSCLWFVGVLFISAATVDASVVFDWPTSPGWTAGTPAAGQTKTQQFTSVNPNDITVDINNSGAGPQGMVFQANYPQISRNPDTGGFGSTNALQLLVSSSQAGGTFIKMTVSFDTPVINLTFQIWDVDAVVGQFVDKIANIQALAEGGGTVGPDSVTSAVAGFNTISGTGLSTVVTGTANANNSSNQGTIDITFNGPITQFSFEWSNNDAGLGAQGVALGPLTYTPVPETEVPWFAVAACAIAAGVELLRRKTNRRTR
jgi:hypothetical protein